MVECYGVFVQVATFRGKVWNGYYRNLTDK